MAASSSSSLSSSDSTHISTPPEIDMAKQTGVTPTCTLDADEISHDMAARLTIALLGQMLYMKGQVPFPVASLARMAERSAEGNDSRNSLRAVKKRMEFLQSYDDLTSHLHTTFVALSTALALNGTNHPALSPSISSPHASTSPWTRRPAKVHILLILGHSPSAAKARLLLEFDGFHVEGFGEHDHLRRDEREESETESEESEDENEANECRLNMQTQFIRAHSSPPRTPPPGSIHASSNPFTPSTLSDFSCSSVPSSPRSSDLETSPSCSADASFSSSEALSPSQVNVLVLAQRAEEAVLRAGERLLSRALFAGGESLGFGDEISPTQVHILIRAPRRLAHPTWVPRQTLGTMLDRQVQGFLDSESCTSGKGGMRRKGSFGVGLRTVGVRVQCRNREIEDTIGKDTNCGEDEDGEDEDSGEEEEEDDGKDEMIWWSWDGKLVGFLD